MNNCSTCKWWGVQHTKSDTVNIRTCGSSHVGCEEPSVRHNDALSGVPLRTGFNFGCIHHFKVVEE